MTAWSDQPFPRVVDYTAVSRRGREISSGAGESRVIYEIEGHPGWLAKLYKSGVSLNDGHLDRLIGLPDQLSRDEVALVDTGTSWPVSRILDAGPTVGVVLPLAPDGYSGHLSRGGRQTTARETFAVDLLCQSEDWQRSRGLRVPSRAERRAAGLRIARIGALFEGADIVYGDWSYANALWNPADNGIYVIDVDSCEFGSRPWVETPGWEDPQVPSGQRMDGATDRYRVGLLVARVVTGERSLTELPAALSRLDRGDPAAGVLVAMTNGQRPKSTRPKIKELVAALTVDQAGGAATSSAPSSTTAGANVTSWRPVKRLRKGSALAGAGSAPSGAASFRPPTKPQSDLSPRTTGRPSTPRTTPTTPRRPAGPTGSASSRRPASPAPPSTSFEDVIATVFGLLVILGVAVAVIAGIVYAVHH